MRIAVSVLAILFAMLHIIAAATQFKSRDPAARGFAVAMACGGISAIGAAISHLAGGMAGDISALSIAYLLICLAAYMNGRRSGNVHVSHHLIRGGIAVLLVLGFFLW